MVKPGPAKDYLNMYEVDEDGCWLFTGAISKRNGYGMCRGTGAHRYFYEHMVGEIPAGMHVDHVCHDPNVCKATLTCKHRRCVNPDHLNPATPRENVLRSNSFVASNAAATHCPYGHEYSGDNLVVYAHQRTCHTCQTRRWKAKRDRDAVRVFRADALPVQHDRILRALTDNPQTDAQCADLLGLSRPHVAVLRHSLQGAGLVADTGDRFHTVPGRRPAIVWGATR